MEANKGGCAWVNCPGSNQKSHPFTFYTHSLPSNPGKTGAGTGHCMEGPCRTDGQNKFWAREMGVLEKYPWHQDCAPVSTRQHKLCHLGTETKQRQQYDAGFDNLRKLQACSSFHSFSTCTSAQCVAPSVTTSQNKSGGITEFKALS